MNIEFTVEKSRIPEGIKRLKEEEKIYLYGNQWRAEHIKKILDDFLIHLNGILVSRNFINNKIIKDDSAICYEDAHENLDDAAIVAGYDIFAHADLTQKLIRDPRINKVYVFDFGGTMLFKLSDFNLSGSKIYIIDGYFETLSKRNLSYEYFNENKKLFEQTYEWLEDELSKKTMELYLKGHIELKNFPFQDICQKEDVENQYFPSDIITFTDHETVVDCGAYTGDTFAIFCPKVERFNKYYALEPNKDCFSELKNILMGCDKGEGVHIPKGAWSEAKKMGFAVENAMGMLIDTAESTIEVDRIDSMLPQNEKVTFIKMDIEGAELEALKGAEKIIRKGEPTLAICIYHKREDLITIPQYIRSLSEKYKFYLRPHRSYVGEVVLYAVCNNDIL